MFPLIFNCFNIGHFPCLSPNIINLLPLLYPQGTDAPLIFKSKFPSRIAASEILSAFLPLYDVLQYLFSGTSDHKAQFSFTFCTAISFVIFCAQLSRLMQDSPSASYLHTIELQSHQAVSQSAHPGHKSRFHADCLAGKCRILHFMLPLQTQCIAQRPQAP